ncbi:hypothetical protein [Campylobacter sp. 19-13652]|uniref:hypothetical protein n=1 Tax=Campylobacter sp. 19-13652 TaxID=2840180 RepID=UPI001C78A844|nr:hypothetical protein [Campylobacter sp. 19-13652]BCX79277.1 hypothetical protein LBC_07390 [Campylobacter sp. 19-13652]
MLAQVKDDFNIILELDELSQDAIYIRFKTNEQIQIKCVFDLAKFNQDDDERRTLVDTAVAYVKLDFNPEIYDTIICDTNEYRVMQYAKRGAYFRLSLELNRRFSGVHSTGRFR